MINPHFCYAISWTIAISVYQLGWSDLYPPLSTMLLVFLLSTVVGNLALSWWCRNKRNSDSSRKNFVEPTLNPWLITIFIYVLLFINFVHEDGIPLVKVILKIPFDYKTFGTPLLHVFIVSFSSFYTVYLFHLFVRSKQKRFLVLFAINIFPAILIYSRSMLVFNLASALFIYLLSLEKLPYKKLIYLLPMLIGILYLFGVVGTQRVSFEAKQKYNNELFLENGEASQNFRQSIIPKEYFWSYFYTSSPLANLQTNINTFQVKPINTGRVLEFVNNELLFESISKRINKVFEIDREKEHTLKEHFNVSTVYSRSYSYLGWYGMIFMAIFIGLFPFIYRQTILKNPYQEVGIAILCCCYLFLAYDNTIRLMGLGFQLVYPILFPFAENQINKIKTIFNQ